MDSRLFLLTGIDVVESGSVLSTLRSEHGALAIPQFKIGAGAGQSTETSLWFGFDDITKRKIHVDRIIFLSDLCCYAQGDNGTAQNCDMNMGSILRQEGYDAIDRYRQAVNKDCFVHFVKLSGHAQSQLRPGDDRTHLLSGWSEKLLDTIRELEAGKTLIFSDQSWTWIPRGLLSKHGRA